MLSDSTYLTGVTFSWNDRVIVSCMGQAGCLVIALRNHFISELLTDLPSAKVTVRWIQYICVEPFN